MVGIVKYPEGWYVVTPCGEPLSDAYSSVEAAQKAADEWNDRLHPAPEDDSDPGYTQSEMADDWNTYDYWD